MRQARGYSHQHECNKAKQHEDARGSGDVDRRHAPIVREQHRKACKQRRRGRGHGDVSGPWPLRQRRHLVAKQRAYGNVMRAAERPQCERERGE